MKSGLASKEIFRRETTTGVEIVAAQVPSFAHWIIVGAATIDGSYCPTCRPRSPSDPTSHPDAKRENAYVRNVHAISCPRFYAVEGR